MHTGIRDSVPRAPTLDAQGSHTQLGERPEEPLAAQQSYKLLQQASD